MSDWQIGDLAVCLPGPAWVNSDWTPSKDRDPEPGEVCTVASLEVTGGRLALWLRGFDADSYPANEFRKIRPDKHESCEEEFVTLLRRSKPKVRA